MARIQKHTDDLGCIGSVEVVDGLICHASTIVTFDFAMKERYTNTKVENLTLAERPLMAMLAKDEDFMGEGQKLPLIHVNPQGIAGSSRATAQANATNLVGKHFMLTAGNFFGSVEIGDFAIKASRANPGAFLENKSSEIDGLHEQMADDLAALLYGNGGGSFGRRASISGDIVTLTSPQDVVNFEVGMTVVASDNDGSDVAHALRAGSTTVTARNPIDGTITLASAAAITGFTNNDYIFRSGNFRGNTSTSILFGVTAFLWGDNTPPVLYGMTRTSDLQRLAGSRVNSADLVGKGNEERLQLLGAYMTGRFKTPGATHGFLNPEDWQNLSISLQSRGQRPLKDESTRFGFMTIEAILGGKQVKLYPDKNAPKGTGLLLRMQNWKLYSMLKLLHPLSGDGLTMLRKSTTDDYEYRLVSYPCLGTNAPGYSGRVALAS